MRHVPTLLARELGAYFLSPIAYLVLLAFQLIAWLNFWELVDSLTRSQQAYSSLRDPLNNYISGSTPFWIALLVAIPALTMRLIAEERYALFEAFEADESEEDREEVRREMENRMRAEVERA